MPSRRRHTALALLRGINVGGKNKLPMAELVRALESLGLENARTYVQSGNAAFESPRKPTKALASAISERIAERHGFEPRVLLLSRAELAAAIDANPFPEAEAEPKSLHLFFLDAKPRKPDEDALEAERAASERFVLTPRVLYLHAPDGIARSKLAARAEKHVGVAATARNWRTVTALAELAEEPGS